jgi:hypothetical protein
MSFSFVCISYRFCADPSIYFDFIAFQISELYISFMHCFHSYFKAVACGGMFSRQASGYS